MRIYPFALSATLSAMMLLAQGPASRGPMFVSPEVTADRDVQLRLFAPNAQSVRLNASDIPGLSAALNANGPNPAAALVKGENGVWEITVGPVDAGAYRYQFDVDGLMVIDPRNPSVSEANNNVWSLVTVAGSDLFDTKNVPHGAVASVTYFSTALNKFRRMHVYTPPGYEAGKDKYPVFYLLHGAGDNDDSWSSVGRAGIIIDNLIAAKKAKPMIIAMPAGHTTRAGFAPGSPQDEFSRDFLDDVAPYIDQHYRVLTGREHRAIAGLSMGGSQTLNLAIPHLDKFAYVGVFSSGLLSSFRVARPGAPALPPPTGPGWEEQNKAALENAATKKGLKLFWFATGKDDFLVDVTHQTVDLFKKYGFKPVYTESNGGHTWLNWRDYLSEFAPKLFQSQT